MKERKRKRNKKEKRVEIDFSLIFMRVKKKISFFLNYLLNQTIEIIFFSFTSFSLKPKDSKIQDIF